MSGRDGLSSTSARRDLGLLRQFAHDRLIHGHGAAGVAMDELQTLLADVPSWDDGWLDLALLDAADRATMDDVVASLHRVFGPPSPRVFEIMATRTAANAGLDPELVLAEASRLLDAELARRRTSRRPRGEDQ